MPKRGQSDDSPGDRRKPFSDAGGPAGRHAQTHDTRRERVTNPEGLQQREDDFSADLHDPALASPPGHADESFRAADAKALYDLLPDWDRSELDQLPVLREGTRLEQGGVYLDLRDRGRRPFKALGGEVAERPHLYVAKREVDYELWNRLTGGAEDVEVDRPETRR